MFQKMEIREKLVNIFIIVALVATMVVWARFQGMNKIMEIQDLISRNRMSEIEFMMRLSLFL
jgi:CHASE3 domain sensor protein